MFTMKAVPLTMALLAGFVATATADEPPKGAAPLDLSGKTVQRLEVSQSQIGFTSTRVFYTLADQRAVVVIDIDNGKKGFPVTGKVCQFAKEATPEGMAKGVNNQHSDGLFPDVPGRRRRPSCRRTRAGHWKASCSVKKRSTIPLTTSTASRSSSPRPK